MCLILTFIVQGTNCIRYEYSIFENPELTNNIFLNELKIAEALYQVFTDLSDQINILLRYIKQPLKHRYVHKVAGVLAGNVNQHGFKYNQFNLLQTNDYFAAKKKSFPNLNVTQIHSELDILKGAAKGVLMLQETYQINVELFANNLFHSVNEDNSCALCLNHGKLDGHDLAYISNVAFHQNWYDSAIVFLKRALTLVNTNVANDKIKYSNHFLQSIADMASMYATTNNHFLETRKYKVGPNWKLIPFAVEKGMPVITVIYLNAYAV